MYIRVLFNIVDMLIKYVTVLTRYKYSRSLMVEIKHKICGCIYKVDAYNFLTGRGRKPLRRCPICYEHYGLNNDIIEKRITSLYNDRYSIIMQYVKLTKTMVIQCNKYGKHIRLYPEKIINSISDFCCEI